MENGINLGSDFLKAYVKVISVIFPKKNLSDIIPGEFGILKVEISSIISGEIPVEINGGGFFQLVTIKGPIPAIEMGGIYYFEGELVEDRRFGFQYEIKQLHKEYILQTKEQERVFLTCILGEKKTEMLYSALDNPIEILEKKDIKALVKIKGIGESSAISILKKYEDNMDLSGDYVQLEGYGLSSKMITKMQRVFKSTDTILYLLKNNPYVFINVIEGIGWEKADAIALNGGLSPNGENRIKAYIKYYLRQRAETDGHSWVLLSELVEAVWGIAPSLEASVLQEYLREWSYKNTDPVELFTSERWLYYQPATKKIGLSFYRKLEEQIALHLHRLITATPLNSFSDTEIEEAICQSEKEKGFDYTEEQRAAIYKACKNNICIITGSAGCGKTTIMHPIVLLMNKKNRPFAQCSLSGKAASNLSEITQQKGYTIHRLLGFDGDSCQFKYNENHQLPCDTIILDELSLVGGEIFLDLLKAFPSGGRLIMIGDPNQLEAIGLANLLKDCMNTSTIPVARLTKIHRQAARSGIITESLRISAGEQIIPPSPIEEVRGELNDLKIITYSDSILSHDIVIEEYTKLIQNGIKPSDISVIVPLRTRGGISCYKLNNDIQALVNADEQRKVKIETKDGGYELRVNDRILITKNRYDIFDIEGNEAPIFNGNTGYVAKITDEGKELVVYLTQQGFVRIPRDSFRDVELGYALTCHKSQGSANNYIIIGLDYSAYTLLSKEWVYTAITRAKKMCILVSQISALRASSKISRVTTKNTWLPEILREMQKGQLSLTFDFNLLDYLTCGDQISN